MSEKQTSYANDILLNELDQSADRDLPWLLGHAPKFVRVKSLIHDIARCDVTVLITGETGTGKELFARAIHCSSLRRSKTFLPLNCAAIPPDLLENELFGHRRGAFTDAHSFQSGVIHEAEEGTLFLDEVECLSLSAQAKLLRFIEEKKYKPLGWSKYIDSDVRIIAATNVNLKEKTKGGAFRDDLFYRLNVVHLELPSLRDRKEDIPLLAVHFMDKYGRIHNNGKKELSSQSLHSLCSYDWPGNIRELENVIQQAVVLAPSKVIQPDDLKMDASPPSDDAYANLSFRQAKARAIEGFERSFITRLLLADNGNITHAAKEAGMDARALRRLLRKYGIDRFQV